MRQFTFAVSFEDQQYAFRAGELGGFLDDKSVQPLGGALGVEAQSRIREALERLAYVGLDRDVREKALLRKLLFRTVSEPGRDDFAIDGDLVDIVAAQPFVAQMRDAIDQEPVGPFDGFLRLPALVARGQRLGVPPPDL